MPNKRTKAARERALELLESPEYKLSLLRRISNDTLAPLMERSLWEYAYGPPKQRIDVSVTRADYSELSHEELAAKALEIRQQLLEEAENERRIQEEAARTSATEALLMAGNNDTIQ